MVDLDVQVYEKIPERNRAAETRPNGKKTNAHKRSADTRSHKTSIFEYIQGWLQTEQLENGIKAESADTEYNSTENENSWEIGR